MGKSIKAVTYKNQFNNFAAGDMTKADMNLFFAICSAMKGTADGKMEFDFGEMMAMSKSTRNRVFPQRSGEGCECKDLWDFSVNDLMDERSFLTDLIAMAKRLTTVNFISCIGTSERDFKMDFYPFFSHFGIDAEKQLVTVEISKHLIPLLNDFENGCFTKFELEEFQRLKSRYSKTAYRLCHQWKNSGGFSISAKDFKLKMGIRKGYSMDNITKRVLGPITKELSPIFPDFEIKKSRLGANGKVEELTFSFRPMNRYATLPYLR